MHYHFELDKEIEEGERSIDRGEAETEGGRILSVVGVKEGCWGSGEGQNKHEKTILDEFEEGVLILLCISCGRMLPSIQRAISLALCLRLGFA